MPYAATCLPPDSTTSAEAPPTEPTLTVDPFPIATVWLRSAPTAASTTYGGTASSPGSQVYVWRFWLTRGTPMSALPSMPTACTTAALSSRSSSPQVLPPSFDL